MDRDTALSLLSSWQRRAVLDALATDGPLPRDALATILSERRERAVRRNVELGLHHTHLPKLVSHEAVVATRDGYLLTDAGRELRKRKDELRKAAVVGQRW